MMLESAVLGALGLIAERLMSVLAAYSSYETRRPR